MVESDFSHAYWSRAMVALRKEASGAVCFLFLSPVVFRETLTKMDIEKSQYYCKEQNDDNVYSFINHRNDFKMFKTLH